MAVSLQQLIYGKFFKCIYTPKNDDIVKRNMTTLLALVQQLPLYSCIASALILTLSVVSEPL